MYNMGRNLRIACIMLCLTVAVHLVIYQKETTQQHTVHFANFTSETDKGPRPQRTNATTAQLVQTPRGDGLLYKEILGRTAPFLENYPKHLVILGYQRVGSSFFGQMFDKNPQIFYMYEPLDGVYTEMYGTMAGYNVPSDITYHSNGTERQLPEREKEAVRVLLSDILNCRVSKLPPGFILHKYWYFLSESYMPSWRSYRSCLKRHGVLRASETCRENHLIHECPSRFGLHPEGQEHCRQRLERASPKHDNPFGNYKRCMQDAYHIAGQCIAIYEQKCTRAHLWATKTVRGTMDELDDLMETNPNMRIIHLVRDPRPVVISRKGTVSYRGIYSGNTTTPKSGDIVKESRLYCGTVVRDLKHRAHLEQRYPDRVVQVIYEDFVQSPGEYAQAIYEFLDEEIPDAVMHWIKQNTMGKDEKRNAKFKMNAWKDKMTYMQAENIVKECQEFYQLLNYKWPYHDLS